MAKALSIQKMMMGDEPVVKEVNDPNEFNLIKLYNWYNYNYDPSVAKTTVVQYIKNIKLDPNLINKYKSTPDNRTVNWLYTLCRLHNRGTILSKPIHQKILNKIKEITAEKEQTIIQLPVVSVFQKQKEKIQNVIGLIEEELDSFYQNKYSSNHNCKINEILKTENVKSSQCQEILNFYCPLISEIENIKKDKEGYEKLSKKQIDAYINYMHNLKTTLETYVNDNKKIIVKKARRRKEKSPIQLAKKLQYLKEFKELNITSADPVSIPGASQVWLYNTKYKRVTRLIALDHRGLSIKGTTIINFDPDKSESKNVRKPKQIIPEILVASKVQLRTILSVLSTKNLEPKGRTNSDTIILKSIK